MKLSELAKQYDLEPDLLREVVEQDLKIALPKGVETVLKEKEVARILACDGLETSDGKPFPPIIAKEFEEKHKRSIAAKKSAQTRKKKLEEEDAKRKRDEDERLAAERRKHEEELSRREVERQQREVAEAEAARVRAELEEVARNELERFNAEEDLKRRELEAKRLASEFASMRISAAEAQAAAAAPAAAAPVLKDAPPAVAASATSEAAAPTPAPAASAPVGEATRQASRLGSKLASLAKATHEKADHSIKAGIRPAAGEPAAAKTADPALSDEDRRRLIQENIRKNLAMQDKVRIAKASDRARRKPGFATIDRSKTPGGPMAGRGPSRGPGGPGRGPGGPGGARPKGRDNRDHREQPEEVDEHGNKINRRRLLSTEESDLSGKTEFDIALPCTVRELSEASGIKTSVVIAKLFMAGVMANINSVIDKDTVELLAQEFKKTVHFIEKKSVEDEVAEAAQIEDKPEDLAPRPPVVTVMGHVDHGKTSLLDSIRRTEVAAGEAGGITQHIGAYTVTTQSGQEVTFIDTPGHEAFTEMRVRGTKVTDVALIVVDAVDGLMPQTIEALNHAKAANTTLVVALNKIDRPEANEQAQERVLRQLAEQGVQAEEWGGEIAVMRVSAKTGQGIPELLERLALETEVLELKSNHFAKASGTVLEAHRHEGQGITATLLIQRGSLAIGDIVLAGVGYGRVRSLTNWKNERIELAGPSHAVEVIGLSELPRAGDRFQVIDSLKQAAEAAEQRQHAVREQELVAKSKTTTSATIFGDIAHAKVKEVKVIVKCDASGSLEVLSKMIPALSTADVRATIIHAAVGAVSANDITLAEASKALVLAFHVIADAKARAQADGADIDIHTYTVIYELIDDVKKAMSGLLEPEFVEKVIGHAEVRNTFNTSKVGMVAGLYITDGRVTRDAGMRITREHVILHTGNVGSLRRFKEDVREVRESFECGLTIENFQNVKVGDTMEFFTKEKRARKL